MALSSLPAEVLVSLTAILIVAAIGCITALQSWRRISEETKGVKRAESTLTGDAAWDDAYPHDKLKLAVWLRNNGIKPDSHLGDFIRTCWSAWLGGRPASLTELHVLVARRERGHGSTRLSAGIAALLLVFGIVGTLSSIKPVLRDFKFNIAAERTYDTTDASPESADSINQVDRVYAIEKDAASVAANTELVNTLIHNLGNAFWPSLLALIGTIAVVSCRGLYSLSLHKFTLELDRFAVDTLIPRYRVPSLSEQYQEVKTTLASVTESILQREGRFHDAVEKLENLVGAISPALNGLDAAAAVSREAAEKLSARSQSITEGLSRHLGAKSPIHRAITDFESVFKSTDQSLNNLSSLVEGIGLSNTSNQRELESAIKTLAQSVVRIAEDHQSHQAEAKTALREFKDSIDGIPEAIKITSGKAVDAGMAAVKSSVTQLHDEQKKWHADSADELRTTTASGLTGVTKAGQELTTQAERMATSVLNIGSMKTDATAAFKEMADAGKAEITRIGDTTKSKIESTTGKLAKEASNIGNVVDRLSKIQIKPAINTGQLPGDSPGRKLPFGNGSKDRRNVVETSTLIAAPALSEPQPIPDPIPEHEADQVADSYPMQRNRVIAEPVQTETSHAPRNLPPTPLRETPNHDSVAPTDSTTVTNVLPKKSKWPFLRNPFSRKNS